MNPTNLDEQQPGAQSGPQNERRRERWGRRVGTEGEPRRRDAARLLEVGRNLGAQFEEQVQKRPFVSLGAAAGVGFVAGSIFGSRFGQLLLALGLGYLARNIFGSEGGVDKLQADLERMTGERES